MEPVTPFMFGADVKNVASDWGPIGPSLGSCALANATIRDVARAASVSVASVSRALSGHAAVRLATRARIEEAARGLDYVPHAGARSLSLAKAHAIGVVLPDLHGEFFSEIVRGMDREAHARGFHLLLSNMHADPAHAAVAIGTMRGRVDGLAIMAPDISPELLAASLPRALPVVLINTPAIGAHPILCVENRAAVTAMTRHLIDTGRRAIVHIAGPRGNIDADARREGFLAAMAAAGLPARVIDGDFHEEGGAEAARRLLADGEAVDAVFAANDMMAIGCLFAFRSAGVDVPDRIAVAGFDDIPAARYVSPSLTTMRVDIAELGARAVARLVGAITGDAPVHFEAPHPELIVRESTGGRRKIISANQNERVCYDQP